MIVITIRNYYYEFKVRQSPVFNRHHHQHNQTIPQVQLHAHHRQQLHFHHFCHIYLFSSCPASIIQRISIRLEQTLNPRCSFSYFSMVAIYLGISICQEKTLNQRHSSSYFSMVAIYPGISMSPSSIFLRIPIYPQPMISPRSFCQEQLNSFKPFQEKQLTSQIIRNPLKNLDLQLLLPCWA